MMSNHTTWLGSLFTVALLVSSAASAAEASKQALVIGEPTRIKLLKVKSGGTAPDGGMWIGDLYQVSLKGVRILEGDLKVGKTISIRLDAIHGSAISRKGKIFALLEAADAGEIRVVHWGVPAEIVCLPAALIKGQSMTTRMEDYSRYDGAKCTSTHEP